MIDPPGESAKRAFLERILAIDRDSGYRYHEGIALRLLAEVLMHSDPAAADKYLDDALGVLTFVGARNDIAAALAIKGKLRHAAGHPNELVCEWSKCATAEEMLVLQVVEQRRRRAVRRPEY